MMPTSALAREMTEGHMNPTELSTGILQHSRDMNRLLTAAVVNHKFCSLLLSDPLQAVTAGYNGETFELTSEEVQLLHAIKASSLREFVLQLLKKKLMHETNWVETSSPATLNKIYAAA